MSGIEVAGLVLGAFPLLVTAMEHYEGTRKVAGTFWNIRKAHRKDRGRVKDCELKFKLNLKELLIPLLVDEVVDHIEYEMLLVSPGGPGWRDDHVSDAISHRLAESHERYFDILGEMVNILSELGKAFKVDDPQFQSLLKKRSGSNLVTPRQNARERLMMQANTAFQRGVVFQAKRARYSFGSFRRDDLLEEVERCNKTLEELLVKNDRVAALAQTNGQPTGRRISSKLLQYWKHADCIFHLIGEAWQCQCRALHCAHLWLEPRVTASVDMRLLLHYCRGSMSIQQAPQWSKQAVRVTKVENNTVSLAVGGNSIGQSIPIRPKSGTASNHAGPASQQSTVTPAQAVVGSSSASTTIATVKPQATVGSAAHASSPSIQGLCTAIATRNIVQCLATLDGQDTGAQYQLVHTTNDVHGDRAVSLAAILRKDNNLTLTRAQRYAVAAALASAHLHYFATAWLEQPWSANRVYLPVCAGGTGPIVKAKPYVRAHFASQTTANQYCSISFTNLAILLLELCFGSMLEQHAAWQQPGFQHNEANPLLRHFIADQWLKDVAGEAGPHYEQAVKWTLRGAPINIAQITKWRETFAANVVEPLQRCYEAVKPP